MLRYSDIIRSFIIPFKFAIFIVGVFCVVLFITFPLFWLATKHTNIYQYTFLAAILVLFIAKLIKGYKTKKMEGQIKNIPYKKEFINNYITKPIKRLIKFIFAITIIFLLWSPLTFFPLLTITSIIIAYFIYLNIKYIIIKNHGKNKI